MLGPIYPEWSRPILVFPLWHPPWEKHLDVNEQQCLPSEYTLAMWFTKKSKKYCRQNHEMFVGYRIPMDPWHVQIQANFKRSKQNSAEVLPEIFSHGKLEMLSDLSVVVPSKGLANSWFQCRN